MGKLADSARFNADRQGKQLEDVRPRNLSRKAIKVFKATVQQARQERGECEP